MTVKTEEWREWELQVNGIPSLVFGISRVPGRVMPYFYVQEGVVCRTLGRFNFDAAAREAIAIIDRMIESRAPSVRVP